LVPPVVAPVASFPALAGLGAGLQVPTVAVPTIDTIGVPSECLLLKDMFDPNVEVGGLCIFKQFSVHILVAAYF
jgi:RNA-binding protein 39